jgi:hypothetical protein
LLWDYLLTTQRNVRYAKVDKHLWHKWCNFILIEGWLPSMWFILLIIILCIILRLFRPKIKGLIGEKKVAGILSILDPKDYKIINDLMLEVEGKTSQIDHVVISNYGIFVIETKNCCGWIIGDDFSEYWTQVIYKRKEKFYNPIRQNFGHIQALKHHLSEYPDIKYITIIVFPIKAELKIKTKTDVIYTVKLIKTIRKYKEDNLSGSEKEAIFNKLLELNIKDKETRKKHVADITINKQEKATLINADICPKCRGRLIQRSGRYGQFKGCSNYPKCKFKVNV